MLLLKSNLGLSREVSQQAVIEEFLCMVASVLWEQMYVIGCLTKSQHGYRSTRFPLSERFQGGLNNIMIIKFADLAISIFKALSQ